MHPMVRLVIPAATLLCLGGCKTALDAVNGTMAGGTELVLQVQIQDAAKAEADKVIQVLQERAIRLGLRYDAIVRNDPARVEDTASLRVMVRGVAAERQAELRDAGGPTWIVQPAGRDFHLQMAPLALIELRREVLEQTVATLRRRLTELGQSRATVQFRAEGAPEVTVRVPRVEDPASIKALLTRTLSFRIAGVTGGPYSSMELGLAENRGILPPSAEFVATDRLPSEWYLLTRDPVVTGAHIKNASAKKLATGRWGVIIMLDAAGGARLARYTESNIGGHAAFVIDNKAITIASIQSRIENQLIVTEFPTERDATDMALLLRAGSLPAGVLILSEQTIKE